MKQEIADVIGCEGKDGGILATGDLRLFLEMGPSVRGRSVVKLIGRCAKENAALSENVLAFLQYGSIVGISM